MGVVQHPELAVAGYRAVRSGWAQVEAGESYIRSQVLAKAGPALRPDKLAADPVAAVRDAIKACKNLLSQFEAMAATHWLANKPDHEARAAIQGLFAPGDLQTRAAAFLAAGETFTTLDGKKGGWNATATSYLLCMSDPTKYAFAKPEAAFQPAATLLCRRSGEPDVNVAGADRVVFASRFYSELRDLWAPEGFTGDLLDVHTVLFVLGRYRDLAWPKAFNARITSALVRELPAGHDGSSEQKAAAQQMATFVDRARPDDPLHNLKLRDYAYGLGKLSVCRVVEHTTSAWVTMKLGNTSAHEVGVAAEDGTWRILKRTGFDEAAAEAHFQSNVLPRLRELATAASEFLAGAPLTPFRAPKLQWAYRSLDGKTFLLLAAALDPDRCRQQLVAVLNLDSLWQACALLGVAGVGDRTMKGYIESQARCRDALLGLPEGERCEGTALAKWMWWDPAGKLMGKFLRGEAVEEGQGVEPDEEDEVQPIAQPDEPAGTGDWDAFIASLNDDVRDIAVLLRARKNAVLYGPPGTGKTWTSEQLATAWMAWQGDAPDPLQARSVRKVTFHPSYGYEDFIEAFRPDANDASRFTLRPGLLPLLAEDAQREPTKSFLLLIDELNRGDVARILGELITLIEHDKRDPRHARRRMLSSIPLWLPPNLYVLGTMNTADKSISLLDVAVRRRFAFVHTPPNPRLLDSHVGLVAQVGGVRLSRVLETLNQRLLGIGVLPDRLIGHAQLWVPADTDDQVAAVSDRIRYDIIPLVEEYCFSERAQMCQVLGRLVDAYGTPDVDLLEDGDAFVGALRDLVGG